MERKRKKVEQRCDIAMEEDSGIWSDMQISNFSKQPLNVLNGSSTTFSFHTQDES